MGGHDNMGVMEMKARKIMEVLGVMEMVIRLSWWG